MKRSKNHYLIKLGNMRPSCLLTWLFVLLFFIPNLQAQPERRCGGDQTIRIFRGDADKITCGESAGGVIEFRISSFSTPFVIVATDEDNVIQAITWNNKIDFSALGAGNFRVYGLFFIGTLLAEPGTDLDTDPLGGYCDGLTSNFITISTQEPDAGMVTDLDGLGTQYVCPDDQEDVIAFANTGQVGAYAYVVTDTNNVVLAIPDSNNFDFNQIAAEESRVWGIAYTGMLSVEAGDTISPDTNLSSGCFDLSDNFLSVIQATPQGGQVQLTNGEDNARLCIDQEGVFNFQVVNRAPTPFTFVVTDAQGAIIESIDHAAYNFSNLPVGSYQVHGVSYTGNPSINAGDTIQQATLSDDCFDISDNAVTITIDEVDGGQVSLQDGSRMAEVCVMDGESDELVFTNNSAATGANYVYILTNADDEVVLPLIGDRIDFDVDLTTGVNKVYGLSYTGAFLLESGQNVLSSVLADGCFELSSTFVTIVKSQVMGGRISLTDSTVATTICPEGQADTLELLTTGSSTGNYGYLATTTDGQIISTTSTAQLSIGTVDVDTIVITGIAYSGELTAAPGTNMNDGDLSTGCFALSENTVRVTANRPQTGLISLQGGRTDTLICPEGTGVEIALAVPGASDHTLISILTDTAGIVQQITAGRQLLLSPDLPQGDYLARVASYTGNLQLSTGQALDAAPVSDDCFALSANAVSIRWEAPHAGTLSFTDGSNQQLLCPQNGIPDTLSWSAEGALTGEQRYLLTDTENVILAILETPQLDGDTLATGSYRIHGLAYTESLIAERGDTASAAELSTGCYQLSTNFLTIDAIIPEGGTISLSEGNEVFCSGDGTPDILKFSNEQATPQTQYTYLVANDAGVLLFDLGDSTAYDFDQVLGGDLTIYGLAYTGELTAIPGDTIATARLSSDCFSLSANALTIERQEVDGGTVRTTDGRTTAYVCAGDGNPDLLTFTNDGQSVGGEYLYLITTANNLIIGPLSGNSQNFENTGFPELRVWGVSYTGNLSDDLSGNIRDVIFSDGCYQLSDNYLTVVRDLPQGGRISTVAGEADVTFCPGPDGDTLSLMTTSASNAGFRYAITDTDSVVITVQDEPTLIMSEFAEGEYLIFGVSYTGQWQVDPGDTIGLSTVFSDDCFVLAQNQINLQKGGRVDGSRIEPLFGAFTVYTCPNDTLGDIVGVSIPTDTLAADYRIVITDENNLVEFPDVENPLIDFNRADPGIYRIYGVSYTGAFEPQFGENLFTGSISSECFEPSDNFIEVVNFQPNSSLIRTSEGLTELTVDGVDDSLLLQQEGAVGALPYRFLLTTTENEILSVITDSTLLVDSLAEGSYRIWGVNYTGEFLAVPGMLADTDLLADNCYALSDNFISLTVDMDAAQPSAVALRQNETAVTSRQQRVQLQPNPATEVLMVSFEMLPSELSDDIRLQVVSLTGEIVIDREIGAISGQNRLELDIHTLEHGMYVLRLANQGMLKQSRFVKVQP